MGKVSFKYGTASQLTNAPYSEGTFYVISDNGSTDGILYADLNNKRICFGDVASLEDDVSELSSSIPTKISELVDDSDFIKQYYGTCGTAADTVQKEVTINSITELTTGLTIFVKFTYANSATNPTLKLNNFNTKYIKRYGTTAPNTSAASSWNAGGIVCLTYDGTYWYLNDWNNTTYSALSESEMKTGTATTGRNITAARLKQAVEYHAPVSSVNGQTGEVSITIPTVPTNVSDFTNDAGYLTSYTETDPIFNSSAAANITSANINTWNNKLDTYSENEEYTTQLDIQPHSFAVTSMDSNNDLSLEMSSNGFSINDVSSEVTLITAAPYNSNTGSVRIHQLLAPQDNLDAANKVYVDTAVSGLISQETDPTVPSWAKASTKPSYNFSEIGSTPTTISGYGITDAYTKTQVDGLVAGVLHYKGTKAAVSNLPTSGNTTGDTWHVTADGSEWAWDGTAWQELGTAVDLSDYVTTDDSRLSDARTPTAHNQALSTITGADDLKAIEALSGTNGLLKKTAANTWTLDSSNYLTSYTETDPVFSASAAADISNTDINNWNKRSNLWTVSSDHNGDNYYWTLAISQNNLWNLANAPGSKGGIGYITLPVNRNGNVYNNVQLQLPITNGTLALTSDIPDTSSFLTSETDPVFSASAAANISSTDISNWNSKTSNTGTVTSIGLSNATDGGLTISGSPITNSGSITIGHSNVLSSAENTQAVYPIKIDKNGHISAHGAAVNIVNDLQYNSTQKAFRMSKNGSMQDVVTIATLKTDLDIPTKVSDLTNDSGFISSYTETDPIFSSSAAAGITSTDISNWNAKVSDDKTWNGVELAKQQTTNTADGTYVPLATSTSPLIMSFTPVKKTPTANAITKYDSSAYLYSTTPSANDNSTKVATTAYVDAAIPDVSGYVSKSGDTMSGRLTLAYSSGSTNGHRNGGLEFTGDNNTFAGLHSSGYNGDTSSYTMKLKFESGGSNSSRGVILEGIASPSNSTDAANKGYVDNAIPKVYSSTNTSGYLTMATLPIYDGTVV